jgi:hypothetical protein
MRCARWRIRASAAEDSGSEYDNHNLRFPGRDGVPPSLVPQLRDYSAASHPLDERRDYAANFTASLCPRILTVCCSCSVLSGFFKTVIGPFARMRSSISLSG